jgi:SAM-dependent methyltransferase
MILSLSLLRIDFFTDVGHGTGESLLFLLSGRISPRPAHLVGITSLEAHYLRSHERVSALLSTLPEPKPNVELYHGDAVFKPDRGQTGHPLDPAHPIPCFTAVLALDCAYHFNSREDFLRNAYSRLQSGGRVALADIAFASKQLGSWWTTALLQMLGMPRVNVCSTSDFEQTLQRIGFVDVEIRDITDDVFPGFVRFLRSQGGMWLAFAAVVAALHRAGARYLVVSGAKA